MAREFFVKRAFRKIKEVLESTPVDVPTDSDGRPIGRRHRHWLQWLAPLYDRDPRRIDRMWRQEDEHGRPKAD